ncbi:MAG: hypothetical protein HC824_19470 [Synechococcales cyanobacterium RM1_1_8]|nr:hypothetical protein [Synechococcales cyanobacterium RM1_1_8]
MYDIQDEDGSPIPYDKASGKDLFKHGRHRMTDYDQVLDDVRLQGGSVSGYTQKVVTKQAAEQILEHYRDEHVKVIRDSQHKGFVLKQLMQKAGVSTAQALTNFLDSTSEKIKKISHLENSQRSLQVWNDTYRVQRELVKTILKEDGVSPQIVEKVNRIYSTRSSNRAIELGVTLLDLEKSEILNLVKSVMRYAKS